MIKSMTGFGRATLQLPSKKITIEIKSLNSKGADINMRLPTMYREMELGLRNRITQCLERGKIDFSIYIDATNGELYSKLNIPSIKLYMNQFREIVGDCDEIELLKMAIRMPDSMKIEREEINEEEWKKIQDTIEQALEHLLEFRISEGSSLEKEFRLRIANIKLLMDKISLLDQERIKLVKIKLQTAIADLKSNIDENRFEQELVYYIEKLDITEEKVRLSNHLDYFLETLENNNDNGRKLGFITQEMGREINTMGSKSNHAKMQKLIVQMKDELEKIKEQILNVL